jgi:hypothetical protein
MATVLKPIALKDVPQADRATALNFKQIEASINKLTGHVTTNVATSTQIQSQSTDLIVVEEEIAALQAAVAALQAAGVPEYTATQNIGADSVVYESAPGNIAIADASVASTANAIAGITQAPVVSGAKVAVAGSGVNLSNPSWNWTVGPVFLGLGGMLTQSPLSTVGATYLQMVGYATSPTTILVMLGAPILLSGDTADQAVVMTPAGTLALSPFGSFPSSVNTIPAGATLHIPSYGNLFLAGPLVNNGSLLLDGKAIGVV